MSGVPVLEVGGTHVTAALVTAGGAVERIHRRPLWPDRDAGAILAELAGAAGQLRVEPSDWGVALPGPFDYDRGIGRYTGVGKFDALNGVDVRAGLLERIRPRPASLRFLNDAEAFAIGEWVAGLGRGHDRILGLTLGTGIGSCFLAAGIAVHDGPQVPPGGQAHRLTIAGQPLEEVVSRRGVLAGYRRLRTQTPPGMDVDDIAGLARTGDTTAYEALTRPFALLGNALGPWVQRFRATLVVVGGSMARSWDLVGAPLTDALRTHTTAAVTPAADLEHAALVGAAACHHTAVG